MLKGFNKLRMRIRKRVFVLNDFEFAELMMTAFIARERERHISTGANKYIAASDVKHPVMNAGVRRCAAVRITDYKFIAFIVLAVGARRGVRGIRHHCRRCGWWVSVANTILRIRMTW